MLQKKLAALIQEFNQSDTILVISKYPHRNIGESFHGVAVYTRDTLQAISKHTKQKFVVLVERQYGRQAKLESDGSILILPSFEHHSVKVFVQLWSVLKQFDQVKNIQLHSEFYNSGNLLQMSLLLPFLYGLRLQGRIISFIAHNVVHDFAFLQRHFGKDKTDRRFSLLSQLVPWYYRLLSLGVEQFITLDESIRQRLSSYLWRKNQVKATSIWLKNKKITKQARAQARREFSLNNQDLVLAVFGFMSHYKGVDLLLQHFLRFKKEFPKSRFKLLLAGGMAPSQKDQPHYLDFYRQVQKRASQHTDITLTGFIPDHQLARYMAIVDVVLLPYRGILGASASWAMVLNYAKACFFSEALEPYLQAADVKLAMKQAKLAQEELLFALNYAAFRRLLLTLEKDKQLLSKAQSFSKALRQLRSEKACVFRDFPPLYFSRLTTKEQQACYNVNNEEAAA
jgi:glycosyltransferase involved in cell wall biosynthesis